MSFYRDVLRPEPDPGRRLKRRELWHANISPRYAAGSLDKIPDEAPHKEAVLAYARELPRLERAGTGVVLSGPVGTGKSTIGCQFLIWALLRSHARCYYVEATEIPSIAIEKPVTDQGESVWALLRGQAQLLVIDDLGTDKATNWNDVSFRRVLNGRYGQQVVTIITTNLTRAKLFKRVTRLGEIFADTYRWLDVPGPAWREDEREDEDEE